MLKEKLQIFLITYNRAKKLHSTLDNIFSPSSPIKNFDITVIDNNSNDDTARVIKSFQEKFPNLKYRKNRYNIGGNANIARTFELAEKEYFWILCDDDKYDWAAWNEVEEAVEKKADLIVVSNVYLNKANLGSLIKQLTFLPSGIFKTSNITDDVIQNTQFNIPYLFPHLAIVCSLINSGKFENRVILSNGIVIPDNFNRDYTRGLASTSSMIKNTLWITGFINSIQFIQEPKTRTVILDTLLPRALGFFSMISAEFKYNRLYCANSFKNICDVFCGVSTGQKLQFLLALVWLDLVYFVKKFILRKPKYIGERA